MPIVSFPELSAPCDKPLLEQRVSQILASSGFHKNHLSQVDFQTGWSFYGSLNSRLKQLEECLGSNADFLWAARGGYGVSGLLGSVLFEKFRDTTFIGFSDFTALMSAHYAISQGLSWHASMPGGAYWYDKEMLSGLILQLKSSSPSGSLSIREPVKNPITGKLFGGCFSVLTNLIGTPYFPKTLKNHIIILEDIEEHPARLMRYWRQWEMSGVLKGVQAVVFGQLVYKDPAYKNYQDIFIDFLKQNSELPIYTTDDVGHIHNNKPFLIGADGVLEEDKLKFSAPTTVG